MPAGLLRSCAGLGAACLLVQAAGAQGTIAQASTVDCSDAHSSPTTSSAFCAPPPVNGLSTTSGATISLASAVAGGDVLGEQVTFRGDDFAGAGGNSFDFLTFTGATPPSRVFVYFLASVDASATSGNDNTYAQGSGEVHVAYAGMLSTVGRHAEDYFGTDPTITDTQSPNVTMEGGLWRASFDYAGPGGSFGMAVGVFGELLAMGGPTPLAGGGSGRAAIQLAGFGVADAGGNPIADAGCSFQSATPCAIINVTATPEPSLLLLLSTGLLGIMGVSLRVRRRPVEQQS